MLSNRHLLGLKDYPGEDIQSIIDMAFQFREVLERPIKRVPSLQGHTIVNLFFERKVNFRVSIFDISIARVCSHWNPKIFPWLT